MSKRSERNKQFGEPSVSNLYHGYRKVTKQKLFKKCKCGDENEEYVLIVDPETQEIEGGIKLNKKKKKSSPTKKSKPSLKKGGRKTTKQKKKNKKKAKTLKRKHNKSKKRNNIKKHNKSKKQK